MNELAGLGPAAGCEGDKTTPSCQLGLEKHESGQTDCAGFQRAPRFCDSTDQSVAHGCFTVPADLRNGHYVFQWCADPARERERERAPRARARSRGYEADPPPPPPPLSVLKVLGVQRGLAVLDVL